MARIVYATNGPPSLRTGVSGCYEGGLPMDDAPEPQQFWIRNHEGKVWGPMAAASLGLLVPQGVFPGRLQASTDGRTFAMIGRFRALREELPEDTWGIDPSEVEDEVPADAPADDAIPADALGTPVDDAIPADALGTPVEDAIPADALGTPVDEAIPADALGTPVEDALGAPEDLSPPGADEGTDPGLSGAQLPEAGELAEIGPVRLAYLVAAAGTTCRLELSLPAGEAWVFYRKGAPEAVHDPARPLGAWLVSEGLLDEAKRRQAEEGAASYGGSFTAALFALGLVDPGSFFPHLGRHAAQTYQALLRADAGAFRIVLDPPAPGDAFSLGSKPLAHLVAAARGLDEDVLVRRLGARLAAPAMKSNASVLPFEALPLGPQEARLYPLFDGVHSAAELAATTGEGEAVLRVAWLLGECDFLAFDVDAQAAGEAARSEPPEAEPAQAEPPQAEAPRAAAPTAPPQAGPKKPSPQAGPKKSPPQSEPPQAEAPTDWAAEGRRLAGLRDRFARADHFAVLGLPHQCTDADVKGAFTEGVRRYHPDRAVGAPDEVKAVLRDLFDRVNEAYRALADPGKRRAYLNDQASAALDREGQAATDDALGPIRKLLGAEKWAEAAVALDALIADSPGLAAAWAWRAYTKVRLASAPKTVRTEAVEMVNRALKIDPKCGDAWLAAGRIAEAFGDATNAERYLAKAKSLGARPT